MVRAMVCGGVLKQGRCRREGEGGANDGEVVVGLAWNQVYLAEQMGVS